MSTLDERFTYNDKVSSIVEESHWVYDPNGMDWNLGAWVCSNCRCRNDNLPPMSDINPLNWCGSKFCGNCGLPMTGEVERLKG